MLADAEREGGRIAAGADPGDALDEGARHPRRRRQRRRRRARSAPARGRCACAGRAGRARVGEAEVTRPRLPAARARRDPPLRAAHSGVALSLQDGEHDDALSRRGRGAQQRRHREDRVVEVGRHHQRGHAPPRMSAPPTPQPTVSTSVVSRGVGRARRPWVAASSASLTSHVSARRRRPPGRGSPRRHRRPRATGTSTCPGRLRERSRTGAPARSPPAAPRRRRCGGRRRRTRSAPHAPRRRRAGGSPGWT